MLDPVPQPAGALAVGAVPKFAGGDLHRLKCNKSGMRNCWSWEGEDVLARKILLDRFGVERGTYLDIGAHHPFNHSNTALLHCEGWRGINIDARPGSMAAFEKHRPEDINLELAIGPGGVREFVTFSKPDLSGFVGKKVIDANAARGIEVVSKIDMECHPINDVLDAHVGTRPIDLLNLDVEGGEAEILSAFDFSRWRPKLIIVEILGCDAVADVAARPVHDVLLDNGYGFFSRLDFSCLFADAGQMS